jgi:hypothetical protein
MNAGGKSLLSPSVARIRMTGNVSVEIVPESTARSKRIVPAGKTDERRTYPAEAEETISSFVLTNCSTSDSGLSFCFLHETKGVTT